MTEPSLSADIRMALTELEREVGMWQSDGQVVVRRLEELEARAVAIEADILHEKCQREFLEERVAALEKFMLDNELLKRVAALESIVIDELPGVTDIRTEPLPHQELD